MVIFMPEKCTVIELARRGAAELRCGNSTPRIILEHEAFSQGGLFLDSCAHVRMLKAGPLQRVSPFLASLSDVRSWTKVTEGLLKMYCVRTSGVNIRHFF